MAEETAKHEQTARVGRESAQRKRRESERAVLDGSFRNFKNAQPILILSVLPLEPRVKALDFAKRKYDIIYYLRPLDADGYDPETFGGSLVTRTAREESKDRSAPTAVTELTHDAQILATSQLRYIEVDTPRTASTTKVKRIDFRMCEVDLLGRLQRT